MTQSLSVEVSKLAPKLSGNLRVNLKKQAVNNLVATLFNTVRMAEWEFLDPDSAYRFPLNKKLALWLTPTSVEVRKGIRVFPIGKGKDAERLFNNIRHAQAVIAKAVAEQNQRVSAFCEAFDIDAELAASECTVSADQTRVDIDIDSTPVIDPAETSLESETAAALLAAVGDKEELSGIADAEIAVKNLQINIEEEDLFTEALRGQSEFLRNTRTYSFTDALKSLQGRILGIVDASFSDKEQRSAVKTLINKEFRREIDKTDSGNKGVSDES